MAETTPGTLSTAQLLVNINNAAQGRSTEVITPTGTVIQAILANSDFLTISPVSTNVVLQVRGISATANSADGGGSINTYVVGAGTVTPLTLSGGGAYSVPAASQAIAIALGSSATDVIEAGATLSLGGGTEIGIATDSAGHLIVPITFTNTSVTPF
jgi:hypothetical protein